MAKYKRCPTCGNEAPGGWSGVFIQLHKCNNKDHIFCDECKNGDSCPKCGSNDVWWNYDKAITDKG